MPSVQDLFLFGGSTMRIDININPPEGTRKRRSYTDLIGALRTNNDWIATQSSEVAGTSKTSKQSAVHAACGRAGLRVETRTTPTQVFVRNLKLSGLEMPTKVNAKSPFSEVAGEVDFAAAGSQ